MTDQTPEERSPVENLTKEEKYDKFYRGIHEKIDGIENITECGEINIEEFGTPGGADLDIRFVTDELPDEETRNKIRDAVGSYGLESHVFFSKKDDWVNGKVLETQIDAKYVTEQAYLVDGVDLHETDVVLADYSLLQTYLVSTSRTINKDGTRTPSELSKRAFENIDLTNLGGTEFAHLYTVDFLHDYINMEQKAGETDEEFEKRFHKKLAKSIIRIALGNVIAKTDENDLPAEKQKIFDYLNDEDKGESMDERLAMYIVQNHKAKIDSNLSLLLLYSGKLRSNDPVLPGHKEYFQADATNMIFYLAFQQGMEQRLAEEGAHDTPSAYALTSLFEHLIDTPEGAKEYEGAIERITVGANKQFMTAGEKDDNIYLLPVRKADGTINSEAVANIPQSDKEIEIKRGRILGLSAFSPDKLKPTASVSAKDTPLELIKINGDFLRRILKSTDLIEELIDPEIPNSTPEAKALDVFLRMNAFEMIWRLNNYAGFTTPPHIVETMAILTKGNALEGFYDPIHFQNLIQEIHNTERRYPHKDYKINIINPEDNKMTIFSKGDKPNGKMYLVKSGSVRIVGIGPNGADLMLPAGSVFGESNLAGIDKRGAAAIANNNSEVYEIDADWFIRYANIYHPELLYHIAAENLGRLINRLAPAT